jgi:Tol biopolymer transport system component
MESIPADLIGWLIAGFVNVAIINYSKRGGNMMNNRKLILGVLITFMVCAACNLSVPSSITSIFSNKPKGTIVFVSNENGNNEIVSYDMASGNTRRLTRDTSNSQSPACIDKTGKIGFLSDRGVDGKLNIYTMDKTGKNVEKIGEDQPDGVQSPNWSKDGKYILIAMTTDCSTEKYSCNPNIFSMNADGTNLEQLTDSKGNDWTPMWSPDGRKIVYFSDDDGDSEIYIMNADGSHVDQLTDNDGFDGFPRWSPDGKSILFVSDRDGVDWDLYVMDADGSNVKAITNNTTNDFNPSWSPDGKWITFVSDQDGDYEIYIVDTNGENLQRITDNGYMDFDPVWCK